MHPNRPAAQAVNDYGLAAAHLADGGDALQTGASQSLLLQALAALQASAADEEPEAGLHDGLQAWRDAIGADGVCIALLDDEGRRLTRWIDARPPLSALHPQNLQDCPLEAMPALALHLVTGSVLELPDTAAPLPGYEHDASFWHDSGIRALQITGFQVSGRVAGVVAVLSSEPLGSPDPSHGTLALIAGAIGAAIERVRLRERLDYAEQRLDLIEQAANDGLWEFDVVNRRTFFSPRWLQMLGYDRDDGSSQVPDWRRLVHPDDMARVQNQMREHVSGRLPLFHSIHRMRHANGEWRWVSSRAKAVVDASGRLQHLIGMETDITERKLYEEALFREKESAQITLQSIGDAVITTDENCLVQYLNPVAEELTGWKMDDAAGLSVSDIFRGFHEETAEPLENPLALAIRRSRNVKAVRPVRLLRRDGGELYVEHVASPRRDAQGNVSGGVLVFHDVTEARELNRRLSYHASHDLLTGLINRREFEQRLERALIGAKTRHTPYALLHLKLDQLRQVNDSCGHDAGDAVLSQVGALLRSRIDWRDGVARLGGDEFGVLLENHTFQQAQEVAEDLRQAVSDARFSWEDRTFRLGLSCGVVPIQTTNEDASTLLAAAYGACLVAKESGGNRVHGFAENDLGLRRRQHEMQWAARLNKALEEDRFELCRQWIRPLHQASSGDHYELLLRLRDEKGELIPASQFISAAERYGLACSLDRWVIKHVLRLLKDGDEQQRLSLCSINLSGQSLVDEHFLPFVIRQFERTGVDARKICFEITETAAMANYEQANCFIAALKELGCRFALDDFGAGWSSFGYLKHLPVDFLKIDGGFVKGILQDPIDREMVRSINEIGHLTGKLTIAEFAENDEIIAMLASMGVDYAQGYGVQEPQSVRVVDRLAVADDPALGKPGQ